MIQPCLILKSNTRLILRLALVSFSVLLITPLGGCKKDRKINSATNINLSYTNALNGIELNWDRVNTSDFVRYEIYRSSNPIPLPEPNNPINLNLLIGTISNADQHRFVDSTSSGLNHYRVLAVLKFRELVSNSLQIKIGFSIPGGFSAVDIDRDNDRIYIQTTFSTFSVIDYNADSLLISNKTIDLANFQCARNENGVATLYGRGNAGILREYNSNLDFVKTHPFNVVQNEFKVVNGILYKGLPGFEDSIVSYNLASDIRIAASKVDNSEKLFMSGNKNVLVASNSTSFNMVNSFVVNSNHTLTPLASILDNTYSMSLGLFLSNDGNRMVTLGGAIFDKNFNFLGNLENPGFQNYSKFLFTDDDQTILGLSFNRIDVFDATTYKFRESISLGVTSIGISQLTMFLDGKKVIVLINGFDQFTGQQIIQIKSRTLN